ncbi:MAG: hypothetical protein QW176_08545 [Candidatus Bathyarchaeia archaeon]
MLVILASALILGVLIYYFAFDSMSHLCRRIHRRLKGSQARTRPYVVLDAGGVPMVVYPGIGPRRNPVTVSTYALRYYEEYVENPNPLSRGLFMNCIR